MTPAQRRAALREVCRASSFAAYPERIWAQGWMDEFRILEGNPLVAGS